MYADADCDLWGGINERSDAFLLKRIDQVKCFVPSALALAGFHRWITIRVAKVTHSGTVVRFSIFISIFI